MGDNSQIPRRSTSTSQKRASRRQSAGGTIPSTPITPTTAVPQNDGFVDASDTLPPATPVLVQEPVPIVDDEKKRLEEEQQRLLFARQQEQEEMNRKRAEEERAAVAAAVAAEREAKRVAIEKEAAAKKAEEEKIQRERMEAERMAEEKKLLQQRIMEAEKNKDVILSGYVSVQPHTSPVSTLFT